MKTLTTVLIATMLLFIAACSSKQGSSDEEKKQSETTMENPKPPAMDIHAATFMGDIDVIRQHIAAGSDLNLKEPTMLPTLLCVWQIGRQGYP